MREQTAQASGKAAAPPGPQAQDAQAGKAARAATDVATCLARAYKNLHFYGANNPVPRESIDRLFAALTSYLEGEETLTYTLTETDLCYRGKPVYTNPDRRESFVFKLFRDGVRAVSFHNGIGVDDVTWLLEALSRSKLDCEDADGDVVTQIWERDLAHITYIAVDDYFEQEPAEEESARPGREARTGVRGETDVRAETMAPPAPAENRQDWNYGLAAAPDFSLSEYERAFTRDLTLTEEELGDVGHEILAEERDDPRIKVSQIFLDVARSEVPAEIKADATRVLQSLCSGLLEGGKPSEAASLLGEIKRMLDDGDVPADVRVALDSFIEARGDEKELALVEARIEEAGLQALTGYSQYLSALNPNCISPLCNMLGRLKTKKSREMLCRVLSVVGRQNLPALLSHLSDPRWYLVRNVVYILRLMRVKEAGPHLESLVAHEDPRVRMELAYCLAEMGDERAQAALAKLLTDAQKSLRLLAAKKLSQCGGPRAAAFLSEHVRHESFSGRDSDEKSQIFDALSRTGSDEALPVLEKLIYRRSLLNWSDNNEMKRCAIAAAGRLGTDSARVLLERAARRTRGGVRRACLDALKSCNLKVSQGGGHE